MRKKLLLGVTALAIAVGVAMAPQAEAQFIPPGNPGPFGNPNFFITLNEVTSPGTPFFATIAATGNTFSFLRPAAFPILAQNAVRLGQGLVNAGFNPTSPARWPFAPQ